MFKKIHVALLSISLLFIGIFFAFSNQPVHFSIELLYEVDTIEEAQYVADTHSIDLIDYSSFGYAIYQAPSHQIESLIENGFIINQEYTRLAPPFSQTLSDPYIPDQYAIGLLDLTNAWKLTEGSSEVMIAIIDSGIDTDHEEFVGRISPLSYNARTKMVGINHVEDDNGHGTAVAGVIGAIKGNNKGIAGVIQNAPLLIIKANNADNTSTTTVDESNNFSDASIIEGIRYATQVGADVINLSLGGKTSNSMVQNAISDARRAGVIVVAASGNFNEENPDTGEPVDVFPASYFGVISVGSVNSNSVRSTFSMYSLNLDVVAPGEGIVTTSRNNSYSTTNGTSFAAPMVSGVIGLMISYLPNFSSSEIISQLILTSNDLGLTGFDMFYGHGLVDAYQALLVEYVTVTFQTDGGTQMPTMNVAKNITFTVDDPVKTGYTFAGWFKDSLFTQYFQIGVDKVSVDTTLYARFVPNTHTVTYVTSGTAIPSETVLYDQLFTPTDATKTGHDFSGWYLEATYVTPYTGGVITGNLVLYAKFVPKQFTVTFVVNGQIDQTQIIDYHTIPSMYNPEGEFPFVGWHTDQELKILYEPSLIESDLVLYARFDDGLYYVTFYTSDLMTILTESQVLYGSSIEAPEGPTKPSSPSFIFIFSGWSSSSDKITEDTKVYPVYTMIYKPESIVLMPGIDTLVAGEEHQDSGVSAIDPLLEVSVVSDVNSDIAGRYVTRYDIYHDGEIIDVRYRVIHVLSPQPNVEMILNPDVTTLKVGETYVDQGATSPQGEITVTGSVDTNTPGTYMLTYTLVYNEKTYQITKMVHVLSETDYYIRPILYVDDRKGVWFR